MEPSTVTIPVALAMSAGSTLAGMAGTWAVLRYKVERAAAAAAAAHRRLDLLEPTVVRHGVLHESHDRRLTEALDRIEGWVKDLGGKLDSMLQRELDRAKNGR